MLGIEYPIFQGGMAWIADAELAAAVSNAGGLGIIPAGNADGNYVREQINKAKELTSKPFGLNIMLLSPFADEIAQIAADEKIRVVTTGAGNPTKYMQLWLDAGISVIPVVPSITFAKLAARSSGSRRSDTPRPVPIITRCRRQRLTLRAGTGRWTPRQRP